MNTFNKIENSIYRINTANGSGTGFYSQKEDVIITNYHVVAGSKEVSIEGQDKNRYIAQVIFINPGKDIAFLRAENYPKPIETIAIENAIATLARDKVMVLGYPYGMPFTVTEGIVSNAKQIVDGRNYIQTDAAINPGNSGGPIVNEKGELIGIVTSKFSNADNIGFAIPVETLLEELEIVSELNNNLTLGCHSCNGLIQEKTNYCPNCGSDVDEKLFEENPLSDFSQKVEEAISKLNIKPVLARTGRERWYFHQGSAEIRMFVYDNNYLFATSPLNDLPRTNLEAIYEYILTTDTGKHRLSISDNQIFLSYRIHISDLYSDAKEEILNDIAELAVKADHFDDLFVNDFGAKMTNYSK
ncbi:trypsin-like peptidase domain-containing protein [Flavobacterium okayamense]|uniref:Protease n=1 Tax=Flavobacterium okayamense TaxID=2830782 RepID=A0ABN6HXB4_9FLAO|nr:trypsin-like peptidase domain-containing protein [Flavobacterium okayamense]BCY28941.1 protease [Flavobacterium okayamense]